MFLVHETLAGVGTNGLVVIADTALGVVTYVGTLVALGVSDRDRLVMATLAARYRRAILVALGGRFGTFGDRWRSLAEVLIRRTRGLDWGPPTISDTARQVKVSPRTLTAGLISRRRAAPTGKPSCRAVRLSGTGVPKYAGVSRPVAIAHPGSPCCHRSRSGNTRPGTWGTHPILTRRG